MSPTSFQKAKYTSRKKGKNGKWIYVYDSPEGKKKPVERKEIAKKGKGSVFQDRDGMFTVFHGALKRGSERFKTKAEAMARLDEVVKDFKSGKLKPPSQSEMLDMYD